MKADFIPLYDTDDGRLVDDELFFEGHLSGPWVLRAFGTASEFYEHAETYRDDQPEGIYAYMELMGHITHDEMVRRTRELYGTPHHVWATKRVSGETWEWSWSNTRRPRSIPVTRFVAKNEARSRRRHRRHRRAFERHVRSTFPDDVAIQSLSRNMAILQIPNIKHPVRYVEGDGFRVAQCDLVTFRRWLIENHLDHLSRQRDAS